MDSNPPTHPKRGANWLSRAASIRSVAKTWRRSTERKHEPYAREERRIGKMARERIRCSGCGRRILNSAPDGETP